VDEAQGGSAGVGMNRIKPRGCPSVIETTICADGDTDMDDIRDSFSRFKKDVKDLLRGKKHALDRAGADAAGEGIESSGSLPPPDPHVATSGDNGEGRKTCTDTSQARSRDRSPQPELIPVGEGHDESQRGEAGVGGKGVTREHSRPAEIALGSETNREISSPSSPSLLPIGKPDSTWLFLPHPLCLIVS
jgi:hypothetical protein